jgi:hypothetical protein
MQTDRDLQEEPTFGHVEPTACASGRRDRRFPLPYTVDRYTCRGSRHLPLGGYSHTSQVLRQMSVQSTVRTL